MHLSTLTPVLFPSIYLYGFYPFLSHLSSDLYLNEIRKTTPVLLPTIYLDGFYLIFQHLFENSLVVEKIYASPFSTHLSYLAFSFSLSSISLSFQLMFAKPFLASQDALEVMRVTDWVTYWLSKRSHWLYWSDPGEWGYLLETWLMWPWWVMIPIEDFTDVILITLMTPMTLMNVI